jgi:hypothetical protein
MASKSSQSTIAAIDCADLGSGVVNATGAIRARFPGPCTTTLDP